MMHNFAKISALEDASQNKTENWPSYNLINDDRFQEPAITKKFLMSDTRKSITKKA